MTAWYAIQYFGFRGPQMWKPRHTQISWELGFQYEIIITVQLKGVTPIHGEPSLETWGWFPSLSKCFSRDHQSWLQVFYLRHMVVWHESASTEESTSRRNFLGMSFWNLPYRAACEFTKSRNAQQDGPIVTSLEVYRYPRLLQAFSSHTDWRKLKVDPTIEWLVLRPQQSSTPTSPSLFQSSSTYQNPGFQALLQWWCNGQQDVDGPLNCHCPHKQIIFQSWYVKCDTLTINAAGVV